MQWIEAIINLTAFAGFIGVASFAKQGIEPLTDCEIRSRCCTNGSDASTYLLLKRDDFEPASLARENPLDLPVPTSTLPSQHCLGFIQCRCGCLRKKRSISFVASGPSGSV